MLLYAFRAISRFLFHLIELVENRLDLHVGRCRDVFEETRIWVTPGASDFEQWFQLIWRET
jgi:hypothetical protein